LLLQQFYISAIPVDDQGIRQLIGKFKGMFLILFDQFYVELILAKVACRLKTDPAPAQDHYLLYFFFLLPGKSIKIVHTFHGRYKIYLVPLFKYGIPPRDNGILGTHSLKGYRHKMKIWKDLGRILHRFPYKGGALGKKDPYHDQQSLIKFIGIIKGGLI